eukprot:CAMPEP_0194303600 /NCGR_PEP_ID=MMETSP0171-20130528/1448_1 /TAXON_ID=218684 /ORGANISM="Corethron pennatum, Strain L29A3" /LENGTH=104 /DNA_ID=CAMNT_0039054559 /DNA_START=328 /DNA_END=642 /DNA_ORIENTATION=+
MTGREVRDLRPREPGILKRARRDNEDDVGEGVDGLQWQIMKRQLATTTWGDGSRCQLTERVVACDCDRGRSRSVILWWRRQAAVACGIESEAYCGRGSRLAAAV